jgi:uncharacterized membrane protein
MNQPTATRGLRERLPHAPQLEPHFRWRGTHVSRIEGLTDAVFAFTVTLLVVALEVPHTFEGLINVVRGLPAFVICFAFLMTFWNAHFHYQRRYGLEDVFTRIMTMAILVLVLFSVYPLKFLFTMLTNYLLGLGMRDAPVLNSAEQADMLYLLYGLGFAGIYGLYAVMYWHAWRKREQLALSATELLMTRQSLCEFLIHVGICLLSIVLAMTTDYDSLPGYIYMLLGPLHGLSGWYFGRRIRAAALASTSG